MTMIRKSRRRSRRLVSAGRAGHTDAPAKKKRAQLITSCSSTRFPMYRLSQLTEHQVDMLVFISSGISPWTRPADFGAKHKRAVREASPVQYHHLLRTVPTRLDHLCPELSNIEFIAFRLGYQLSWLPPELRERARTLNWAGAAQAPAGIVAAPAPGPDDEDLNHRAMAALGDADHDEEEPRGFRRPQPQRRVWAAKSLCDGNAPPSATKASRGRQQVAALCDDSASPHRTPASGSRRGPALVASSKPQSKKRATPASPATVASRSPSPSSGSSPPTKKPK